MFPAERENLQPRILPTRLSFRIDGEIKNSDEQNLKEFHQYQAYSKRNVEGLLQMEKVRIYKRKFH